MRTKGTENGFKLLLFMYDLKNKKNIGTYLRLCCHHSFNILLEIEINQLEKDRNG